jgi:asparagine synthase (glutamine-hydrolysing)
VKLAEMLTRTPSIASMYLLRRELFLALERRALHALPSGWSEESGLAEEELADLATLASRTSDPANTISAFELAHYLRDMLLRDADVFSMAVGLELRVPLLDHAFVEAAVHLPGRWKKNDGRAKPLLLDAVGPRMPGWVGTQRKRGFTFPWRAWLTGPLRQRGGAALANRDVWRTVGIAEDEPEEMWRRFLANDARVGASQIVALWVLAEYAQARPLLPPT